jgi:hypothetical protein
VRIYGVSSDRVNQVKIRMYTMGLRCGKQVSCYNYLGSWSKRFVSFSLIADTELATERK